MSTPALIPAASPGCKERTAPGTSGDPWRWAFRGSVLLIAASVVWRLLFDPVAGPALCPTRALLGVECPGCGMTRSFVAMTTLDLPLAWRMHPVGPAFFLVLASIALHGAFERLLARSLRPRPLRRAFLVINVLLLAAFLGHALLHMSDGLHPDSRDVDASQPPPARAPS